MNPSPNRPPHRRAREVLLTAALAVVTLLAVLITGELVLRALGYGHGVQYSYVSILGWVHRPRQRALTIGGEAVRIDSNGFRGPEVSRHKPSDVYRILLLGDSYTFGYGVAEPATYAAVLAAALPGGSLGCMRTEVINSGVNGYGTVQEVEFLRRIGASFQPDLVIVGFTPNDLMEQQETRGLRWPWLKSTVARSAVYQFLAPRVKAVAFRAERRSYEQTMTGVVRTADSTALRRWAGVRSALLDAQAVGVRNGFQVVVAIFPTNLEVESPSEGWLRPVFAELSAASGLPTIDLLPAFRAASKSHEVIFLEEPTHHPNARGHAITGQVIAQRLLAKRLVPACLAPGARFAGNK